MPTYADGIPLPAGRLRAHPSFHVGAMAGQLLLRTFGRAERIYQAVLCRGGEDPEFVNSRSVITGRGAAGGLLFCILVILFRCFNITMLAGQYARSLIP